MTLFNFLYNKLFDKYNKIIYSFACIITLLLSYFYLYIALPLNSDTTGTYAVGRNYYTYLSYKSSIETGRWAKGILELLIEKIGYHNVVPFFLYILLILVCTFFIINLNELFIFNNIIIGIFISSIFFITPAFVSLFTYYQDLYSHITAILLSSFILQKTFLQKNWKIYIPILIIIIGLYQAYFSLITTIYIIYCIHKLLNNSIDEKKMSQFICEFFSFLILTFISIVIYYVIFIFILKIFDLNSIVSSRFGTNFSIYNIIHSLLKMYGMIFVLPFKNYAGLNTTFLMKIVYILSFSLIIYIVFRYLINNNYKSKSIALIILIIILPIFMNCVALVSQHIVIRMTIGLGIIYLFIAIFFDYSLKNINLNTYHYKSLINILLIIVIAHMIYYVNGFVFMSKLVDNATKSFTDRLVTDIKSVSEYSNDKKVYFYGTINDNNLKDYFVYYDANVFPVDVPRNFLLFPWEYKEAINRLSAFNYEEPKIDEINRIINTDEFKNLKIYPNYGSIVDINGIIVVKFSN